MELVTINSRRQIDGWIRKSVLTINNKICIYLLGFTFCTSCVFVFDYFVLPFSVIKKNN